jgi:hypothetical protein
VKIDDDLELNLEPMLKSLEQKTNPDQIYCNQIFHNSLPERKDGTVGRKW